MIQIALVLKVIVIFLWWESAGYNADKTNVKLYTIFGMNLLELT